MAETGRAFVLFYAASFLLVACDGDSVTQPECSDGMTSKQFTELLQNIPECQDRIRATLFEANAPILDSAYDHNNDFTGFVDFPALTDFCKRVEACKRILRSSCQGALSAFITNAGTALCDGAQANESVIREAINALKSDQCEWSKIYNHPERSDACQLGRDAVNSKTYMAAIQRTKRLRSAAERCAYRYMVHNSLCSGASTKAYATLLALSLGVQLIGRDFSDYTDYATVLGPSRMILSLRGLIHLSANGRVTTCSKLPEHNLLLWNTHIRIDGTVRSLKPQGELSALNQVTIYFASDEGVVIDSYSTATAAFGLDYLPYETAKQQAKMPTTIITKKLGTNKLLITHPGIRTDIIVAYTGDSLSLYLVMPTALIKKETVGLLLDGCEEYGGTSVDVSPPTEVCRINCSNLSRFKEFCGYSCSNGLHDAVSVFSQSEELMNLLQSPNLAGKRATLGHFIYILLVFLAVHL